MRAGFGSYAFAGCIGCSNIHGVDSSRVQTTAYIRIATRALCRVAIRLCQSSHRERNMPGRRDVIRAVEPLRTKREWIDALCARGASAGCLVLAGLCVSLLVPGAAFGEPDDSDEDPQAPSLLSASVNKQGTRIALQQDAVALPPSSAFAVTAADSEVEFQSVAHSRGRRQFGAAGRCGRCGRVLHRP